jgi:prepilin-type N-terminal cleavage/methylation domain-containing protein
MRKRALNQNGFTLIEIIVSLLLVGIVAAVVGLASVNMVDSFLFAKTNAATLQKGQIAIARIQKELNNIKTVYVSATNGSQIKFTSYKDAGAVDHTICLGGSTTCGTSGTNLLLDGIVLTDKVSSFSLAYYSNYTGSGPQPIWLTTGTSPKTNLTQIIEINFVITGWQNTTSALNARVAPSFDITLGT